MLRAELLPQFKPSPLAPHAPKTLLLSRRFVRKIPLNTFSSIPFPLKNPIFCFYNRLRLRSNPNFQVNAESSCCGGLEIDADEILDVGDRDLPVDLFLMRTLPPALTLKEGYEKINNAIGELKANPPSAISGVLRYQVELSEFDGCSLLASTLAWDDSMSFTFERAVYTFESYFHQMIDYIAPVNIYEKELWMSCSCGQSNAVKIKNVQMDLKGYRLQLC